MNILVNKYYSEQLSEGTYVVVNNIYLSDQMSYRVLKYVVGRFLEFFLVMRFKRKEVIHEIILLSIPYKKDSIPFLYTMLLIYHLLYDSNKEY